MKKQKNKNKGERSIKQLQSTSFNKFLLIALMSITSLVYIQSLNNQITTWDDEGYLTENKTIKSFHGDSVRYTLKEVFTSYELGNYHPLTMLSYCMEYNMFKLNPKPYHFTNLVLHLFNTLLVFWFIWLLTQQQWVAFITALLFAIHPMHVESVAWVAERKDVLYSFFYIAGLCVYILFLKNETHKWKYYWFTLFLFILSALSKGMAVSFPIVLFSIDYFFGRKITYKIVLEKLPFIVVSVVFGCIAIIAQKTAGAMNGAVYISLFDRFLFTCYGIIMYLWKLILPINLTCFYNYPAKINGLYPIIFYIAPFIVLIISFVFYKYAKTNKDILFGTAFFFITIALVLQILPVGGTIISERYTYIPYIGVFFIFARICYYYFQKDFLKNQTHTITLIGIGCLIVIILSYLSFKRVKVWHDDISLYSDAIKKFDQIDELHSNQDKIVINNNYSLIGNIYYNRARTYFKRKNYEGSINDFTESINYCPTYFEAYNNRGNSYGAIGQFESAINDYSTAIKLSPRFADAYYNRAGTYYNIGKYDLALKDLLMAKKLNFKIDPRFMEAIQVVTQNKKQ